MLPQPAHLGRVRSDHSNVLGLHTRCAQGSNLVEYQLAFAGIQPAKSLRLLLFLPTSTGRVDKDDRPIIHLVSCDRSEEHTSELQSLVNLVCRLLLEKKKLYGCGFLCG